MPCDILEATTLPQAKTTKPVSQTAMDETTVKLTTETMHSTSSRGSASGGWPWSPCRRDRVSLAIAPVPAPPPVPALAPARALVHAPLRFLDSD